MLSGIGQHAALRGNPESLHDGALLGWVHVAQTDADGELAHLHHLLLAHPLCPMMGKRVADLMAHDDSQLVWVRNVIQRDLPVMIAGDIQDAGINGHIPARQAEGVRGGRLHDIIGPVELIRDRREVVAFRQQVLLKLHGSRLQARANLPDRAGHLLRVGPTAAL